MKAMILALLMALVACATTMKPTLTTNPNKYLETFPLGSVTEETLVGELGVPDDVMEQDGKRLLSYRLGRDWGKRQYVYVVSKGIVVDVRYYDQGPYSGGSAREKQGH